jgi:hypothetical protein
LSVWNEYLTGKIEMDYDVFVCHASEDKGFVEPLAQALRNNQHRP